MEAGFAKSLVNPPLGMPMEGLGQQGGCQTIHDDLFVRALSLTHDGVEVVIIGCDLLFFERPTVARFKEAIGRATGLAPEQLFLNTSHTHAGPRLTHWAYTGAPDPDYLTAIEKALVEAVTKATERREPVTLSAGMTRTDLPVNRRKPDAEGKAQWAPYRNGGICDALPICMLNNNAGEVVALLFSISCHPSMIYTLDISAEYPGVAMRRLNAYFQTEGAMFLQGAGGDTKPRQIAVDEQYWRAGTWEEMEAAGVEVSDAVIARIVLGLTPVTPALRNTVLPMSWPLEAGPARDYFTGLLADAQATEQRKLWAEEMLQQLDADGSLPTVLPVGLHALELGENLRLIGTEGELVGELGNRILQAFPTGVTFPMGYTDGAQIYLMSTWMLPEGGYEVDSFWEFHLPAPLAPGTEKVLDEALCALKGKD